MTDNGIDLATIPDDDPMWEAWQRVIAAKLALTDDDGWATETFENVAFLEEVADELEKTQPEKAERLRAVAENLDHWASMLRDHRSLVDFHLWDELRLGAKRMRDLEAFAQQWQETQP